MVPTKKGNRDAGSLMGSETSSALAKSATLYQRTTQTPSGLRRKNTLEKKHEID
jgi:hypothetical protein